MKQRYEATQKTGNGSWSVLDNDKGVTVLKSVSPNASYNESLAKKVVNT